MHHRRLAAFLIGGWIAGSLVMAFVAAQCHFGVDRMIAAPSAGVSALVQKLGTEPTRQFLHHQAYEQVRYILPRWELAQIVLGLLLAGILYLGAHVNRIVLTVCGIMMVLVAFNYFVLTPEINWLGRGLDFGADPGGAGRTKFWILEALYSGLEVLKLLLGAGMAIYLFTFKPQKPRRPKVEDPLLTRASE